MALRKGNKVVFDYIGSITSDKADKIRKQVIIRDKYRENLKKVKQDLIEVGKMIRKRKARIIS